MSEPPPPLEPVRPDAPRLVPGRPLPASRFLPGHAPHPRRDPAGSLHEEPEPPAGLPEPEWQSDTTYLFGIDLYHAGYLWEAHEWFEAGYHAAAARGETRYAALLQALVQLCAALLKAHLGETRGAATLLDRVRTRLREAGDTPVAGLHPPTLLAGLPRPRLVPVSP